MKVLIVEDNATIAAQLGEFLTGHGWVVDFAADAALALALIARDDFDVVILDLNLPDADGLDVCTEIQRRAKVTPAILMATARDTFEDKAAGFKRGADDYMCKPFDLRELVLRCEALGRRHKLHKPKYLELGELKLHPSTRRAWRGEVPLMLNGVCYQVLELLVKAYPEAVSRSYLGHVLWAGEPPESDALKSHIYNLRKVLDKPFGKPLLQTVVNVGYRLEL